MAHTEQAKAELIFAVRTDWLVGRGSCSSIDECMDDDELWEIIKSAEGPLEARDLAREHEGMWLEKGTNQSSGEPDCPLVASYNEFKRELKEA